MNPFILRFKKITPPALIALLIVCLSFSPKAQAVSPPPDGGYPGGNTAEGQNALLSLTTGGFNTAVGFLSLRSDTTGQLNTAIGAGALLANHGALNTATGAAALLSNTTGGGNTATGLEALFGNTTGANNTAFGLEALFSNTTGSDNTAIGVGALQSSNGDFNTAGGYNALLSSTTGANNTAFGSMALISDSTGTNNTANGSSALANNTTGSFNVALGDSAGSNLTTGDENIDIGNVGVAGDANTIRIGDDTHQGATFIAGIYGVTVSGLTVVMDSSDHLGTLGSSRRFKDGIKPMDKVSEAILALKPVTFRYKKEIDSKGIPQFGLVAEDVEKVNPDLIVRDKEGKPYSVRYDQVNAMLLNEFLKEHRKVEEQQATITQLQQDSAKQQKQIEALTAGLQKVSAQLEVSKPAPQTVLNNQ
jgi:hypothetical protein